MASVLVVEDDGAIRAALTRELVEAGHAVRAETTAGSALTAVVDWQPDVVVLDLGLPDIDGRDVLRMIRGVSDVPVIVATARDDETEMIALLDVGRGRLRRQAVPPRSRSKLGCGPCSGAVATGAEATPEIEVGGLVVDTGRRTASIDGAPLELSRLEFDLLAHLARRSPEVVTRRELLAEVWSQPYGGSDKTVDVHLSWLRRKLGETASAPRYLHTVRGVGIKLEPPATPCDGGSCWWSRRRRASWSWPSQSRSPSSSATSPAIGR